MKAVVSFVGIYAKVIGIILSVAATGAFFFGIFEYIQIDKDSRKETQQAIIRIETRQRAKDITDSLRYLNTDLKLNHISNKQDSMAVVQKYSNIVLGQHVKNTNEAILFKLLMPFVDKKKVLTPLDTCKEENSTNYLNLVNIQ